MLSLFKKNGALLSICAILISGCHDDAKTIKLGTIAGPETELAEVAADVAEKQYGLHVKIVSFTDYLQPNAALNDGSLQANAFQHKPYFDEQIASYHYKLAIAGRTFIYPMGIYSSKYHALEDIPDDSQIAIPNDPTNEGRALLLLQSAGLIRLKSPTDLTSTPQDVVSNPKHFAFVELDAVQLTRAYQDVAAAVINTNYAVPAGLYPSCDALFIEGKNSPYANLIVVRESDLHQPWVKALVDAFHSQAVQEKAAALFQDQAIAAD